MSLDQVPDNRPQAPGGMQLLGGCRPWVAAEDVAAGLCDGKGGQYHVREAQHLDHFREAFRGSMECPGCGGKALGRKEYCLRCQAFGLDGRAELPGEEVGSRMDPDYPATPTSYDPEPGLKGGKR